MTKRFVRVAGARPDFFFFATEGARSTKRLTRATRDGDDACGDLVKEISARDLAAHVVAAHGTALQISTGGVLSRSERKRCAEIWAPAAKRTTTRRAAGLAGKTVRQRGHDHAASIFVISP